MDDFVTLILADGWRNKHRYFDRYKYSCTKDKQQKYKDIGNKNSQTIKERAKESLHR